MRGDRSFVSETKQIIADIEIIDETCFENEKFVGTTNKSGGHDLAGLIGEKGPQRWRRGPSRASHAFGNVG